MEFISKKVYKNTKQNWEKVLSTKKKKNLKNI